MALKVCKRRGCKSRNKRAVWLVDRIPTCHSCYEKFLDTHFVDMHSIHRLSDNERDFPEKVHACELKDAKPVTA